MGKLTTDEKKVPYFDDMPALWKKMNVTVRKKAIVEIESFYNRSKLFSVPVWSNF